MKLTPINIPIITSLINWFSLLVSTIQIASTTKGSLEKMHVFKPVLLFFPTTVL